MSKQSTLDHPPAEWDVFISYASEDRDTVVAPLVETLRSQGVRVWYDHFELRMGDLLLRSIDEGLRRTRFGVVILSPNFFAKEWPQRELAGLYQRSIQEGPIILPVWYQLGAKEIAQYSPLLSDIVAARWEDGMNVVVQQILATLRPTQVETGQQTRIKSLAEVRQVIAEPDYTARIEDLCRRYPLDDILWSLGRIAFNIEQPAVIRGRALREILAYGTVEADQWDRLLHESDTDWLKEIIAALTDSNIVLTMNQVHTFLTNRALPRATSGFGRMVIAFIRRGADYTSAVFLPGSTYPFWEVKYDCVRSIIELDDRDSVHTLAAFSTMSYWKARSRILDYLRQRVEQDRLLPEERELAEQIVTQIMTDGKTDPTTPTMRKAREMFDLVHGGHPGSRPSETAGERDLAGAKYVIHIDHVTGLTIGEQAQVTQIIDEEEHRHPKPAGEPIPEIQEAQLWPSTVPNERYYLLPGRERNLAQLLAVLQDPQGPPVIVIDGLGGLGKTAMAVELARRAWRQGLFEGVVGDSAKQELLTGGEIVQVRAATLDFDSLLDAIARQLGRWEIPTLKADEKRATLARLLRQHRYLVLVDNLETAENADALVVHLRSFLDGSRAIATSRKQVRHDFARALSLQGLEQEDSLFFLRTDAKQRAVQQILESPEGKLTEIHQITGGAPLALKLVVAQARFLDLDLILRQLKQATGDLYPFIFRQSWVQLLPAAQRVLIYIGRTVVTTVSWEELSGVSIAKSEAELMEAIEQLAAYSLLEVSFVAEQTRYGIHPLTRRFVNSDLPEMWRQQGLL